MTRALALLALALVAGCGGDAVSRAEAEERASAALKSALSSGELHLGLGSEPAADESMNRDGTAPLGSTGHLTSTMLGKPRLRETDGGWVAAYAVGGSGVAVCVYVGDRDRVDVRERC